MISTKGITGKLGTPSGFHLWKIIFLWPFILVQQTFIVSDTLLAVRRYSCVNERQSLPWAMLVFSGKDRYMNRGFHYNLGIALIVVEGADLKIFR